MALVDNLSTTTNPSIENGANRNPDFSLNQTNDVWSEAIDVVTNQPNPHVAVESIAIGPLPSGNTILESADVGDKPVTAQEFAGSVPIVDARAATQANGKASDETSQEPAPSTVQPVFDDAAKAKLEGLQEKGDKLNASERLEMNRLDTLRQKGSDLEAQKLEQGRVVHEALMAGKTVDADGKEFTREQLDNADEYLKRHSEQPAEESTREQDATSNTSKLVPREQIAKDKLAKLDEAKKGWAPNTVGAENLKRPEAAIDAAKTGKKLDAEQQKSYDDYVSGIESKIESGRTLTKKEESDIRSHYDREQILGKSEMGQELADIGAQVNKEMAEKNGELTDATKDRMADWFNNLFGGKPDEAQKMLIEAIRKGPSDRLKNLFASATPEKSRQVQEMIADLAILEMRYKNADKVTNEIKHQTWDVRDALQQLGAPPSPVDQSEEAFAKRNKFYALEMLLMQKKGEIVQQRFLGLRLMNEYNKTVNEIKRASGDKNWLMFKAAQIGGYIGDMSIDANIRLANIDGVEGDARPLTPREGDPLDLSKVGTEGRFARGNPDALNALF